MNKIFNKKYKNWNELEKMICSLETVQERGDAFEDFCYIFFNLNKEKYNAKEIYMSKDIPDRIKQILNLEETDYGVDGVIETNEGEFISYQAKFRSDRSSPTYRELATFWAESELSGYRCIISNCNDLADVSKKKKNQFLILVDTFLELKEDFFEMVYDFAQKKEIQKPTKKHPLEHQEKIIKDTINGFKENNRGKIISACGTGKTLTALWIMERMGVDKVLFVVPSLSLIKQTVEQWQYQSEKPFKFLCVCSDMTVVGNQNIQDEFIESAYEIGVPVTTNSKDIQKFLENSSDERKIIFSTYQSLDAVSLALNEMEDYEFDLGIFDEAHKTVGIKNNNMFSIGLSDEYIKIKKRLFMTATEKFIRRKQISGIENSEYESFSMDDEKIYGKVFSRLSFGEAIEKNIICDYKIILNCVNDEDLKNGIDNRMSAYVGNEEYDIENLYKQLSLTKIMKEQKIKKVITFHSSVERAKRFIYGGNGTKQLDEISGFDSGKEFYSHINGTYNASKRKRIFEEFEENDIAILSNARCLTEGIDIPIIDGVYFADNKDSIIDIIQAIGRALRKPIGSDKKYAYIILPVIIPNTATNIMELNEEFETFHNVLQAIREEDKNIEEWIEAINYSIVKKGTNKYRTVSSSEKIIINIPGNMDIEQFYNEISYRIATNNKESSNVLTIASTNEDSDRRSAYVRIFKTIGDYSIDSFGNKLVIPTINRYIEFNKNNLEKEKIIVNHNNISHCKRLGLIEERSKIFYLTPIGEKFLNKEITYKDLMYRQMLLYKDNNIFPYRAVLKVLLETEYITKFEFIYCIYVMKKYNIESLKEIVERVNYIRDTYSNVKLMSRKNQEKTLELLNKKYDLNFRYEDVWSSRTTVYNQYNYFKNHILTIFNEYCVSSEDNESIEIINADKVRKILEKTDFVETMSDEEYYNYFCENHKEG